MSLNFLLSWMDRNRGQNRKRATLRFFNLGVDLRKQGAANSDVTEGAIRGLLLLYGYDNSPSKREKVLRDLQAHIGQTMEQLP